jgi:hypothetical protein
MLAVFRPGISREGNEQELVPQLAPEPLRYSVAAELREANVHNGNIGPPSEGLPHSSVPVNRASSVSVNMGLRPLGLRPIKQEEGHTRYDLPCLM